MLPAHWQQTKQYYLFSTPDDLHAVLQLSNKQISFAMPFNFHIIISDCSSNRTEKGRNPQRYFGNQLALFKFSTVPHGTACANMLVDFLIDD